MQRHRARALCDDRQNPLELETPKPNVFLAKRPSDLGLD
jgi:hypothetical protein